MNNKVLFITDTFKDLNVKKDTSIMMIEEAIKKQFHVFQCEIEDLFIKEGHVYASSRNILSAGSTQVEGILKEDIKVNLLNKYTIKMNNNNKKGPNQEPDPLTNPLEPENTPNPMIS